MAKQRILTIEEAYKQEISYIKNRREGNIKSIDTGFQGWNDIYLDGFEYGYIITIGGRSGVGKTTLLNQLEDNIFSLNKGLIHSLNFNYEMSARRLIGKKLSAKMGKSVKQLYNADRWGGNIDEEGIQKIENNSHRLLTHDINYVEYTGTANEMSDTIDIFCENKGITGTIFPNDPTLVVTFDNAQLVKSDSTERGGLTDVMNMFNEKKKRYPKSIYIILSQLNRNIEEANRINVHGAGKVLQYPCRGDLYGNDHMYTTSDAVIIIHAPEALGISSYGVKNLPTKNMIFTHHLKARDGVADMTVFQNRFDIGKVFEVEM